MACQHRSFVIDTRVGISSTTPVEFSADVRVRCAECELPFRFRGDTRFSEDGFTMRAALEPGGSFVNLESLPDVE